MSPELARGEFAALTPASDVWALGCVLFECSTGRPVYEGDVAAIIAQILTEPAPDPRTSNAAIPRGVAQVVGACLRKVAADRYPDAGALVADLQRLSAGGRPSPPAMPTRRGPVVATVLVVAAVAGLALVLSGWRRSGEPAPSPVVPTPDRPGRGTAEAERAWALRATDPDGAIAGLAAALALDPGRDDWQVQRGLLLWVRGRGAEAQGCWLSVPRSSAHARVATLYSGLEGFVRKLSEPAAPMAFRAALESVAGTEDDPGRVAAAAVAMIGRSPDPGRALELLDGVPGWEAAFLRAQALVWRATRESADDADLAAATAAYGAVLDAGLRFPVVLCNRGALRVTLGDLRGALEDYREATVLAPASVDAWHGVASTLKRMGDRTAALEAVERALAIDPESFESRFLRGRIHADQRRPDDARQDLEWCRDRAPQDARMHELLVMVYGNLGRLDDAEVACARALEFGGEQARLLVLLGRLRGARGDVDGSEAALARALVLDAADPSAHFTRGMLRQRRGDHAGALEDLTEATRRLEDDDDVWRLRAYALLDLGRPAEAEPDARRAVTLAPRRAANQSALGLILLAGGRPADALPVLEHGLELSRDPEEQAALRDQIAACRRQLGGR